MDIIEAVFLESDYETLARAEEVIRAKEVVVTPANANNCDCWCCTCPHIAQIGEQLKEGDKVSLAPWAARERGFSF